MKYVRMADEASVGLRAGVTQLRSAVLQDCELVNPVSGASKLLFQLAAEFLLGSALGP